MASYFSIDDPAFRSYMLNAAILVGKMLIMSPLTSRIRIAKGIMANPEDLYFIPNNKGKLKFDDQDVERVRRAHQNDLENIPAFLFIAALYLATGPSAYLARLLFSAYSVCRVGHTLVYAVCPAPQPSRAIFFFTGYAITLYMAASVALKTIF